MCSVPGCVKPKQARGWCHMHYRRWRVNGDPGHAEAHKPVHVIIDEWVRGRDRSTGCWDDVPWSSKTPGGYPSLTYGGRYVLASHVALEKDGRPREAGLEVLHSCDNPACINPAHLRWGTRSENVREAYDRGLNPWRTAETVCPEPGCGRKHKSHYMYEYMRSRRARGIR